MLRASPWIGARSVNTELRLCTIVGLLTLTSYALLSPALAKAEVPADGEESSTVFSLLQEETVSTAIRREQPISQAPSNVYVITAEDIRQSGAPDVPTILRRIPGLEVMQVTGADFNVSVRGNNQLFANKMLVLVDGRSVYIDVQGFVFWKGLPVTLPEIKQIEVIKGPVSALYGFNAFDGVVNIITKSPEEMKGTTLQMGGGEIGTVSTSAVQAGAEGHLKYRISGGYEQSQQWRQHNALALRSYKLNSQAEYMLSGQSKASISSGLVYMDPHDGPMVGAGSTLLTSGVKLPYANVSYENHGFFLRAYWNGFFADVDASPHPLLRQLVTITDSALNSNMGFSGNTYNIEGKHSLKVGEAVQVTYGLNYRHNTFSCDCISTFGKENRIGMYVQGEWSILPSVNVIGGFRYDLHTQINPTYSPRLAVVYTPTAGHTLRAQASIAYRPPTLFETYEDARINTSTTSYPILGSRNLHPERILSYELGYQGWFYRHRIRVRADVFYNRISDLIGNESTVTTVTTVNTGRTEMYGGETGVEFQATSWLTGFANYAFQEIGQNNTALTQRGAPQSKVNAGLRSEWDNGVSGDIAVHYVGPATYPHAESFGAFGVSPGTRVNGYTLLNLRAGYRFWEHETADGNRQSAEFAVSVFNALDDGHREHPLGDIIGRRILGWLTLKL